MKVVSHDVNVSLISTLFNGDTNKVSSDLLTERQIKILLRLYKELQQNIETFLIRNCSNTGQ